jgi:monoamine oxidase
MGQRCTNRAGRIYWAGTERAKLMHGLMEGAVRSGEQAAQDVIGKLATRVA